MNKVKIKLYFCCTLILIYCIKVTGQSDSADAVLKLKPCVSIQLDGGFGLPLGKGYSNSAPEIYSGTSGYIADISLIYPVMKSRAGIMLKSSYEINNFDASTLSASGNSIITSNYTEFNVLAGPCYSTPLRYNLIDFRFLIGPLLFNYPGVIYSKSYMGNPWGLGAYNDTWNESQGSSLLFTYTIGIGLRHLITQKLLLLFNIDVYWSTGRVSQNVKYTNNYTGQTSNEVNAGSININLLNITIGLGYHI